MLFSTGDWSVKNLETSDVFDQVITRAALSTCGRAKSNFCYETRQLLSLILFSFLWA